MNFEEPVVTLQTEALFEVNNKQDHNLKKLLYVGVNGKDICEDLFQMDYIGLSLQSQYKAYYWLENLVLSGAELPKAILCDLDLADGNAYLLHQKLQTNRKLRDIPFIVLALGGSREDADKAYKMGIDDFYVGKLNAEDIHNRISFLHNFKKEVRIEVPEPEINLNLFIPTFKMPVLKRLFDIGVSFTALLFLSPVFLVIAVLIRLESKGPIFYISKRAGTGYKVFDFYKFRSMRTGADKELQKLSHLNQYKGDGKNSAFMKIENDPRITKIGHFLRNTSLDELPQIFNVLKGDMSIVGNRPLPLYEAEQLTKDQWAKRFLAPAGITGLWQVTKRGKGGDMSEEERMGLDIKYAERSSFLYDMGIILKTVPALFQKENV